MAWGKLKTTTPCTPSDNTMYPKPFQDLSGWAVRSMACGASTYAVAAAGGGDESTITWRAPRARPPDARAAPAAGPSGARYGRRPLGRHADAAANAGTPERVRARAQGPGAQRRAGLRREREEELGQPGQVQRAGGRARAPGAAARAGCCCPGPLREGSRAGRRHGRGLADMAALRAQVALGVGHGLFLADPEHAAVKAAEVFTPAVLEEEAPAAPEPAAGKGAHGPRAPGRAAGSEQHMRADGPEPGSRVPSCLKRPARAGAAAKGKGAARGGKRKADAQPAKAKKAR